MKLLPIDQYISAVHKILAETTGLQHTPNANSYLSTKDPAAYQAFMDAKPKGWTVYADITLQELHRFRPKTGNHAARESKGSMGLVGLASLLVAMEANRFVLTTKSNLSAMMNFMRTKMQQLYEDDRFATGFQLSL